MTLLLCAQAGRMPDFVPHYADSSPRAHTGRFVPIRDYGPRFQPPLPTDVGKVRVRRVLKERIAVEAG